MLEKKKTIAVYVPYWLYRNDVGITIFVNGLFNSILKSNKYNLLKLDPKTCKFNSKEEAKSFVEENNLVMVIYHGSRVLPMNRKIERGINFLEECVPFLNSKEVHIADDKIKTKNILRNLNLPVLPESIIYTKSELENSMNFEELYVAKPHNRESGFGVKLLKKTDVGILEYLDGVWKKIKIVDSKKGIKLLSFPILKTLFILSSLSGLISSISYFYFKENLFLTFILLILTIMPYLITKIQHNFTYYPLMLEPFFGDNTEEFYCLRTTVIGDNVVESAKKFNKKNVTPNISHGGKALKIKLTKNQEDMAILATLAVGARYAGIDFLVKGDQTMICEVNVGPIGLYCEQTQVDVGRILGEYTMNLCDKIVKN